MADYSKIQLSSLDFDAIKQNFKTYLQSQSQFQDYDFEGSALNVLLDVLAYNTFYNAYYMNMVANEMFLDTAVLRKSVVSHAKLLGYTPRSARASQVYASVVITRSPSDTTPVLKIPAYTQFSGLSPNTTALSFYTVDDTEAVSVSGSTFTFTNVLLKEGTPVTKSFLYDATTNPQQYFDLVDGNIDTSTLSVIVQTSASNPSYNTFILAQDATQVDTTSQVYYLEEGQNGNYRIYFGDGVIGSTLTDQNIVSVKYLTTNADAGNGCGVFTLQSPVLVGSVASVSVTGTSGGGTPAEDVSSIKFTAPKSFIAQNRAVTKNDYISMINQKYPYFDSVNVWGGDEETPPVYGKVFISAKPKNGFVVTQTQQQYLLNTVLKPISILTVTPEFVDADYNYLNFNIKVNYENKQTFLTQQQLVSAVQNVVYQYTSTNLNSFNSMFEYSKFLAAIDSVDRSVQSSSATIYMEKRFNPDLTKAQSYILKYGSPLHRGTLNDRIYSSPYFILNDPSGVQQKCFLEEIPFSFGGIDQIEITNPGRGYTTVPSVTIEGDGRGANAYPVVVNGQIASIVIDSLGAEYTTATAVVSGGFGSGATLNPILTGTKGTLRIYYFDSNSNKKILSNNAGTVYYSNGTVYLDNFNPSDVGGTFQTLSLYAQPQDNNIASYKNTIVTYDTSDNAALIVNMMPVNL